MSCQQHGNVMALAAAKHGNDPNKGDNTALRATARQTLKASIDAWHAQKIMAREHDKIIAVARTMTGRLRFCTCDKKHQMPAQPGHCG
jgi:hypothetical protein